MSTLTATEQPSTQPVSDFGTPWERCDRCSMRTNRYADLNVIAPFDDDLYKVYCGRHAREALRRGWLTYVPADYR